MPLERKNIIENKLIVLEDYIREIMTTSSNISQAEGLF